MRASSRPASYVARRCALAPTVSKPIRVCRKLEDGDCEGKVAGERLEPPETLTCTDGCTLPALWTELDPRERIVQ